MSASLASAILVIVLLLLLFLGYPIAFAMGTITTVGILWLFEPALLFQLAQISVDLGTNFLLLVIPLFVLMAEFIVVSGNADKAFDVAAKWLNWLPGGLAISSILGCSVFAAVCGSSPVTAATIGRVSIPEMTKRGYDKKLAYGSVASAGTIGIMIPPSLALILYGSLTGTSIGKLFIGGIIPGIVLALLMCLVVVIIVKVRPASAPSISERVSWGERFKDLVNILPILAISFGVLTSIYAGIATPTESASAGAIGALVVFLFSGRFGLRELSGTLIRAVSITSAIMILLIGGTSLAFLMTTSGLPQRVVETVVGLGLGPVGTMILINLILILLGCFLDPMGVLVLTLPLFLPVIKSLGFDPLWFGIVMTLNVEIGMITPPVGLNLYMLKAVDPDLPIREIVVGALPFFVVLVIALFLLLLIPEMALWLPNRMG